jgi:predicted ester cyclase
MSHNDYEELAKSVVRRPDTTPDKDGPRVLYHLLHKAFPDFRPKIRCQAVDGDLVTTYKTYHGIHLGHFFGTVHPIWVCYPTDGMGVVRDGRV